jgi:uncharacterized RDD family membrane protein YckC
VRAGRQPIQVRATTRHNPNHFQDRRAAGIGAVHAILFWISVSALTPFVVIVGLFNGRRRLLHDFLLGTVVVNSERRVTQMRRYGR